MISYSFNFEDVFLERIFKDKASGFYIELEANHPEIGSITKHFSDKGWTGINTTSDRASYEVISQSRPNDINVNINLSKNQPEAPRKAETKTSQGALTSPTHKTNYLPEMKYENLQSIFDIFKILIADFLIINYTDKLSDILSSINWENFSASIILLRSTPVPETNHPG